MKELHGCFELVHGAVDVAAEKPGSIFRCKVAAAKHHALLKIDDPVKQTVTLQYKPNSKRTVKVSFTAPKLESHLKLPFNFQGKKKPGPVLILFHIERRVSCGPNGGENGHANGHSPYQFRKTTQL